MARSSRRWRKFLGGLLIVLVLALAGGYGWLKYWARQGPKVGLEVADSERAAERARLERLGLTVPAEGPVLARPYDPPFTRRSLVVPQAWIPPGAKVLLSRDRDVRAKDALADVVLLEQVMSRAYGGWDSAAAAGFDWTAFFARWRDQLAKRGDEELELDEAFGAMDELFAMRADNHTQVPLQRMFDTATSSTTYVLGATPTGPCDDVRGEQERLLAAKDQGEQPRRALRPNSDRTGFTEVAYLALPSRFGELKEVRCGGDWLPLKAANSGELPSVWSELGDATPEVKTLSNGGIYLRLPSMNPGNYASVAKDRAAWPKPTGKEPVLLVDLRGNGGGSSEYGWQVLEGFVDKRRVVLDSELGRKEGRSCLYPALRWNFDSMFSNGMTKLDEDDRAWLQQDLDALYQPSPPDCPRAFDVQPAKWKYTDHRATRGAPEHPRIVAWVDAGCGSDCEHLLVQLASLPETWIVGVNTGGVSQFIQPGYGILPHTGLPFRIALGESDTYGDQRSVDGHGLDVDLVLADDEEWTPETVAKLAELINRPGAAQAPMAKPGP